MIANDLRFVGTRLKLGAMLRSAKEREVSGHTIILKYPSRSNVERLQQELDNPESKRALDDAIAKAMGSLFQVEVALSNGANGGGMRRASQSSHLVQAAQAMGARVISEREETATMMNRKMMRQAQQLQKQMMKVQEELESATVEASVGGGVVKAVVSGKMKVESITIDPDVVSAEDVDMLQDLVTAAVNEGLDKAQQMATDKMGALTGGMNLPGLF